MTITSISVDSNVPAVCESLILSDVTSAAAHLVLLVGVTPTVSCMHVHA